MNGKVDDLQPPLPGISDGVGRPAALPVEVADTHAAVVHQMAVALVHTASGVLPGHIDHFIRLGLDALVLRYVLRPPAPCLRQAGKPSLRRTGVVVTAGREAFSAEDGGGSNGYRNKIFIGTSYKNP